MEFLIMPIVFLVLIGVYFLPTIAANARHHPSFAAIFILNLLLGWSLIGWVVALVWSFADLRVIFLKSDDSSFNSAMNNAEALEKLAELKDKGVLTEEEFAKTKQKILNF